MGSKNEKLTLLQKQALYRFQRTTATDQSVGRGKALPCPYRMCRIFNSNLYQTSELVLCDANYGIVTPPA